MSADLVILVPVLRRPHRVAPLLDSIRATTPDARVVFIVDDADQAEKRAISEAALNAKTRGLRPPWEIGGGGNYAVKINRGILATDEPLIFVGADDLHFHEGWLEGARVLLSDAVGVVGTNDLCNPRSMSGEHATHFLVARWYVDVHGTIDEPDKLLHEGYPHEFVDDELVATAKSRDAWAHATGSIVEHLHPDVGKAPTDELYDGRTRRMRVGRRLFYRREPLWR